MSKRQIERLLNTPLEKATPEEIKLAKHIVWQQGQEELAARKAEEAELKKRKGKR